MGLNCIDYAFQYNCIYKKPKSAVYVSVASIPAVHRVILAEDPPQPINYSNFIMKCYQQFFKNIFLCFKAVSANKQ